MRILLAGFRRFNRDQTATTSVEYAIMLALILVGCISAILMTGSVQKSMFDDNVDAIHEAFTPGQ